MDLTCGFRQPNVFNGSEGTSYRTSGCFDSRLKFRCRGFNNKFLCNPRILPKVNPIKKSNKPISCSGSGNSSILVKGELNSRSWRFLVSNFNGVVRSSRPVVRSKCQSSESVAYIDGNGRSVEPVKSNNEDNSRAESVVESCSSREEGNIEDEEVEAPSLNELRELLEKALKELEVAHLNSTMFEEKAQKISEAAIALKDEASSAWDNVNSTLSTIEEIVNDESVAKEAVQKATMAFSLAEARVQVAMDSLEAAKERNVSPKDSEESEDPNLLRKEEEALMVAQDDIRVCEATLAVCEEELKRLASRKEELQKEVDRLNEVAEKAQMNALKAEEDVANIMLLAEQAVAFELEATKRLNDTEIALQRAEKNLSSSHGDNPETTVYQNEEAAVEEEKVSQGSSDAFGVERERDMPVEVTPLIGEVLIENQADIPNQKFEDPNLSAESDLENGNSSSETLKEIEVESEKSKNVVKTKRQEMQKDSTRDSSPLNAPKALLNKSSRFFSASFFSFAADGTEFTPASVFHGVIESARKQLPKLVVGSLLLGAGIAFYANRAERINQLFQQPDIITTSIDEVSSNAKPLVRQIRMLPKRVKKLIEMIPHQEINEEEASLFDMLWLLLASVIFVPLFQKIPGGSPVLGYLTAGILIGPYGLSIIRYVHATKAIAEFGVVFLLFNIGLELSVERLSSMKKYVFGLGSAQVLVTAVVVGLVAHYVCGLAGPAAIVIGNGLALSSTAVVLQVLQERGESTSRHGRATFSVLLFQDLSAAEQIH